MGECARLEVTGLAASGFGHISVCSGLYFYFTEALPEPSIQASVSRLGADSNVKKRAQFRAIEKPWS